MEKTSRLASRDRSKKKSVAQAMRNKKKPALVKIENLPTSETGDGSRSFWQTIPIEILIEQQGVSSVSNLDEISSLWPVDGDPDDLLLYILSERAERQKIVRSDLL